MEVPPLLHVCSLFEHAARRNLPTVAVECLGSGVVCTYAELLEAATIISQRVRVSAPPSDSSVLVGVLVPRSIAFIAGILGVMHAGKAFVPMDPTYPAQRLDWMLEGAAVLLHTAATKEKIPPAFGGRAIDVTDPWCHPRELPPLACTPVRSPSDLMYCIFTSGSTGRPKGVLVEHRSAANLGLVFLRRWELTSRDRVFQFFSPSFDPSLLDCMLALLSGARLLLRSDEQDWRAALATSGATVVGLTPSALTQIAPSALPACRLLMVGGEALPLTLARTWASCANARDGAVGAFDAAAEALDAAARGAPPQAARELVALNVYGPTEATIWATSQPLERADLDATEEVSIGRALPGLFCLLMPSVAAAAAPSEGDAAAAAGGVAVKGAGVVGELCIGGIGVARGYLGRPELTAKAFVELSATDDDGGFRLRRDTDKVAAAVRVYRTGDLARYLADGRLVCLGRADAQVKLCGLPWPSMTFH